jgi:hypothetical protein
MLLLPAEFILQVFGGNAGNAIRSNTRVNGGGIGTTAASL